MCIRDRLGVVIDPTALVEKLSASQKQTLEIAKAIFFEAKLLILDEPTTALSNEAVSYTHLAFALKFGKLGSAHLNDQNGCRYDQDKSFGVESLRGAFNQIKVLCDHNYGANGEMVGLDVKAMRTQKPEDQYRHIQNSMKIALMLEEKVDRFDRKFQAQCIAERNYEKLEMYVMELLMGC